MGGWVGHRGNIIGLMGGCSARGRSLRSAAPTDREKVKDRKLSRGKWGLEGVLTNDKL